MTMATEEEHREPRAAATGRSVSEEEKEEETKFVEWDPTDAGRTTQLLGRGTYKMCTWLSTRRRGGTWRGTRSR